MWRSTAQTSRTWQGWQDVETYPLKGAVAKMPLFFKSAKLCYVVCFSVLAFTWCVMHRSLSFFSVLCFVAAMTCCVSSLVNSRTVKQNHNSIVLHVISSNIRVLFGLVQKNTHLVVLHKIQKRPVILILNAKYTAHSEPLFYKLNTLNIMTYVYLLIN